MLGSKPIGISVDPNISLVNPSHYGIMNSKLIYLAMTQPVITFAVGVLNQ